MSLFCKLSELHNESDVELKLLMPLLLSAAPNGPAYSTADIYTKKNILQLVIEKGRAEKVYRPDFIILLAGLPMIVIEAKSPGENLDEALREARLYAAELNNYHPTGLNPCQRVIVSDGNRIITGPADSVNSDFELPFDKISVGSQQYHDFIKLIARSHFQGKANALRRRFRNPTYNQPTDSIGGQSARNEEIGFNTFGRHLAVDYLHIFNPQTRAQRAKIVNNAYVPSRRREHYVDEIDRVIRNALPANPAGSELIADTDAPAPLIRALRRGKDLTHKVFLLVGPVGAGKSTFIDYFREVRLPNDLQSSTVWVSMDMNSAPGGRELLERWVAEQIMKGLRNHAPNVDFDALETLEQVFDVELGRLKRGPLKLLEKDSAAYNRALSDELRALLADPVKHTAAMQRYHCAALHKLLVVVFDNCDKGDQAEQLQVFEIVRWVQSWLQCLVFLPIRDITYRISAKVPPLDTVIKDFVFRIETPPFTEVLSRRIKLALAEMTAATGGKGNLEYTLRNGMKVIYPADDLGKYLACIFRSIYEHDRLLRQMIIGLAGRNMRTAMEIFLDFCKSGHIGEKEFLKIRVSDGNYALPYQVVTRVLLRLSRRYYDGNTSYVKNLFQCNPDDAMPDHFVRLSIIGWLHERRRDVGPSGVRGFLKTSTLINQLVSLGHDADRIREELKYLLAAECIVAEHQRTDTLADEDLVALATGGYAHLNLVNNFDYLAACAEDTWIGEARLVGRIVGRIQRKSSHYTRDTTRANALEFADYLVAQTERTCSSTGSFLDVSPINVRDVVTEMTGRIQSKIKKDESVEAWPEVDGKFTIDSVYSGIVTGIKDFGAFVTLDDGPTGLVHISRLPHNVTLETIRIGQAVRVRVFRIIPSRRRISLDFVPE